MPEIGEIRGARELGFRGSGRLIWAACLDCGKERWVQFIKGQPGETRCFKCGHQNKHKSNWKGGITKEPVGYVLVRLQPDDFFFPMAAKDHYVSEHRLVVAKALNRCLLPWEVVHHKGVKYPQGSKENRADNRYPENLELLPVGKYHLVDNVTRRHVKRLQRQVDEQAKEIKLLKWQVGELNKSKAEVV